MSGSSGFAGGLATRRLPLVTVNMIGGTTATIAVWAALLISGRPRAMLTVWPDMPWRGVQTVLKELPDDQAVNLVCKDASGQTWSTSADSGRGPDNLAETTAGAGQTPARGHGTNPPDRHRPRTSAASANSPELHRPPQNAPERCLARCRPAGRQAPRSRSWHLAQIATFGAARPRIVQLVMAVHKEYSVRSWLRHRVSGTIGIRSRRRGGGLKAWSQRLGNHPAGAPGRV